MDYATCNVVYVDRTAKEDRLVRRKESIPTNSIENPLGDRELSPAIASPANSDKNLRTLLETFSEVHVCTTGRSCISKISELNQSSIVELIPTLVLIEIPYDEQLLDRPVREIRTPSPSSHQMDGILETEAEDAYGLKLLQWIASEIQYQSLSRLIVPVAMCAPQQAQPKTLSVPRGRANSRTERPFDDGFGQATKRRTGFTTPVDQARTIKYLDIGAVDVITSPLMQERLPSLAVHAYRAHKDASKEQRALLEIKRGRKRSWVGVDDQKPYAYLREAMVSGLMDGICKLGGDDEPFVHVRISVESHRREKIAAAIGSWHFSAHDFTDDELLHAALLMLQHALSMPELEQWRISTENLTSFLVACRSAYNAFVPYHNFRHVIDVLQATFQFLVQLGRLPTYPGGEQFSVVPSPIAALIRPFDALTLLITAIGHDVGHPGVNNAFLITLNAPLAQLYNDRSVLESFHCAAYSQILRRYWPAAFQNVEMRQLMINSILATDMGLHFEYMKKMGNLEEKFCANGHHTDGWNGRLMEEHRTLVCSLLIKCADISNVARKHEVAAQWTMILTDEFARQATMEQDLGIPTALFAVPVREIVELSKSQVNFMNMFAIPLFQGVTNIMPAMRFCVDELNRNINCWNDKIADEQARKRQYSDDSLTLDGMFSPRSMSLASPSDAGIQRVGSANTLSPDMDLRKALLSKSPFAPRHNNGGDTAEEKRYTSHPELSDSPVAMEPEESLHPSPNESVSDPTSRRSSKPSQLQLSYATGSAPGMLDNQTPPNASPLANGIEAHDMSVVPSLVTDPVISNTPTPADDPKTPVKEQQRTSDITESNTSVGGGDWASQATSATTGKMPQSPSTKGTSIASTRDRDSDELSTPKGNGNGLTHSESRTSRSDMNFDGTSNGKIGNGNGHGIVKELRRKSSRFRMNSLNFWKRGKSSSPPMPTTTLGVGFGAGERGSKSEDVR